MTFEQLGLSEPLLNAISAAGYTEPTPIQAQAIPSVLSMSDVTGIAQTGTGKTAAFILPLLQNLLGKQSQSPNPKVLIVTPTRELASQVLESTKTYGRYTKFRSMAVFGGVKIGQQIKNLQDSRIEKIQKIADSDNNVKSLEEKISSLSESIEKVKSSDDYKKYLELKNNLESFGSQKLKIKNNISTHFTKISRPLSRYEYASALDKDQKNILNQMINEPFDALISKNKDSIILILENVRKGISSGSISVKDIDKTLSQITDTEETLDGLIKQVEAYYEKYQSIQNDTNSLKPDNLDSLQNELIKNTSFMEDSKLKSKTFQEEIKENDLKIPQLVSEIERKLRVFSNTKYTILIS